MTTISHQGDCDEHDQCAAGLHCGVDNCEDDVTGELDFKQQHFHILSGICRYSYSDIHRGGRLLQGEVLRSGRPPQNQARLGLLQVTKYGIFSPSGSFSLSSFGTGLISTLAV